MSGKYVGASTLILKKYPLTIHTHSICHRLNLCLANSCTLQIVNNMIGTLQKAILFFDNSAKRTAKLKEIVKEVIGEKHSELKTDSMHRFREVFEPVIKTFDIIKTNAGKTWNHDSCVDAQGLYHACSNFEFIITLVIVGSIFARCRDATGQGKRSHESL